MKKNITITNLTDRQWQWLQERADHSGMTITGVIKMWIEDMIKKEDDIKRCS